MAVIGKLDCRVLTGWTRVPVGLGKTSFESDGIAYVTLWWRPVVMILKWRGEMKDLQGMLWMLLWGMLMSLMIGLFSGMKLAERNRPVIHPQVRIAVIDGGRADVKMLCPLGMIAEDVNKRVTPDMDLVDAVNAASALQCVRF